MTPCFISEMPGEKTKALLVGFYQKAWTHDASPLIGGFPAGQIAYPVAVVLLESGDIVTVNAETVTIDTPENLFQQCKASGPVITGNEVEPGECRWDKAREAWNGRAQ